MAETEIERCKRRVESGGGWEAIAYLHAAERKAAEQQRDRLLGVISAHEAEKAHGLTANMDHADAELYAAAEQVEKEKADAS